MADPVMRRFRRSLYVSLGLACVCLTYAEWLYLPLMPVFSLLIGVVLVICYRCEDRWSLSLRAANAVGAVITISSVVWIGSHIVFPNRTLSRLLPWPLFLLPLLGPLVLVIIPAKLLRPKHNGDYWGLQLIGLMAVALACALASDGWVAGFALIYFFAAVRCVMDFHAVLIGESQKQTVRLVWQRGVNWVMISMVAAVVVALFTPRVTDARWEYGTIANRIHTGISDDRPSIDINTTGELRSSPEEAFRVMATTATGQPKLDLSPEQRWRGLTFDYYERGKWSNRRWVPNSEAARFRPQNSRWIGGQQPKASTRKALSDLPHLGPRQFYLTFPYPVTAHPVFYLAEPIWPPRLDGEVLYAPIRTESGVEEPIRWLAYPEGDVVPELRPNALGYRQVTAPTPEPHVSLPVRIDPALAEHLTTVQGLTTLRRFADNLVQDLLAAQRIPAEAVPPGQRIPPEHHENVARAFEKHFETSGQFESSYSLDRVDPNLDPVEDFVWNLRRGHCNRFATALTLLLRCQGIPSRIVLGYHGAESQGDGTYIVRQSHAHSWVECLIRRPAANGDFTWHWLTLDPTPSQAIPAASEFALGPWIEGFQLTALDFVRNCLVELTPERQSALWSNLNPHTWNSWLLAAFLTTLAAWIGQLVLNSRRKLTALGSPYQRLTALLRERRLLKVNPAWTPNELLNEFAATAQRDELTNAVTRIVTDQNERRYGGHATTDVRRLDDDLKLLRRGVQRSALRRG